MQIAVSVINTFLSLCEFKTEALPIIPLRQDISTFQDNDKTLDYISDHEDEFMNKVMTVRFNDLSKSKKNDFYALSHPRYVEIRNDKDETDTLKKVFELRQMVIDMNLKDVYTKDLTDDWYK